MYKYANRSGRYLANELINNKSSNKSIDKMKDKHGKLHYTNIEIAKVFNEVFFIFIYIKNWAWMIKLMLFFQHIILP